jgi:hypothetical protein
MTSTMTSGRKCVLKWSATSTFIFISAAWALSGVYEARQVLGAHRHTLGIEGGEVYYARAEPGRENRPLFFLGRRRLEQDQPRASSDAAHRWYWSPDFYKDRGFLFVGLPLWPLWSCALIVAGRPWCADIRARIRRRRGQCCSCGYDLQHVRNGAGYRCPECGTVPNELGANAHVGLEPQPPRSGARP